MKHSRRFFSVGLVITSSLLWLTMNLGCTSDSDDGDDTKAGSNQGVGGNGNSTDTCYAAPESSVSAVADTTDKKRAVKITGAIVTSWPAIVYFGSGDGTCLWGLFIRDPNEPKGVMVASYGEKAPSGYKNALDCPRKGMGIDLDLKPGDVVELVGEVDTYVAKDCGSNVPAQRQVMVYGKQCKVTKTGTSTLQPLEVTDNAGLQALASGRADLQGMLVKLVKPVVLPDSDGAVVSNVGVMRVDAGDGKVLEVHNKFFYLANGRQAFKKNESFEHIMGVSHLDYCTWVVQARDKCVDFEPASQDCP